MSPKSSKGAQKEGAKQGGRIPERDPPPHLGSPHLPRAAAPPVGLFGPKALRVFARPLLLRLHRCVVPVGAMGRCGAALREPWVNMGRLQGAAEGLRGTRRCYGAAVGQ